MNLAKLSVAAAFAPRDWVFLAASAVAGALAVPLHAIASPLSVAVAGLGALLGLRAGRWSGLPSAQLAAVARGRRGFLPSLAALGFGLALGLLLLGLVRLAIEPALPAIGARFAAAAALPLWRRVVAVYVAAVGEELVFRLLLLSLLAGLALQSRRLAARLSRRHIAWLALAVSALLFAGLHLPAWAAAVPLSPGLALAVLALNALGGLCFGYLFVEWGILPAIAAHAGADCALLLIGPLLR